MDKNRRKSSLDNTLLQSDPAEGAVVDTYSETGILLCLIGA